MKDDVIFLTENVIFNTSDYVIENEYPDFRSNALNPTVYRVFERRCFIISE